MHKVFYRKVLFAKVRAKYLLFFKDRSKTPMVWFMISLLCVIELSAG